MGLFSIFGVFVIALVFFNPLTSLYLSNLGSINQSQIELSNYNPDNYNDMTLDKIRRSKNLSPAQGSFNLSLVRWSRNPTALNRLAQIDMSLKAYDAAQTKMDMAWKRGNWNNVTRLLYSDALVANGEIEEAAQLLQEIPAAQDRLLYQSWYRYIEDFDYMRASYALQTVLLINPENTEAQIRLEKVQELQIKK
jgi:predicted Zn-dependent protease